MRVEKDFSTGSTPKEWSRRTFSYGKERVLPKGRERGVL